VKNKPAACAIALILGVAALAIAQTQTELNRESATDFDKSDAELNKVYRELRATLDDTEKARLKEVQLLWLKYRDRNAEFAASLYEGGSIAPMVRSGAMTSATLDRVKELKALFRVGYPEEPAPGTQ